MRNVLPTFLAAVPLAGLLSGCAMAPLGGTANLVPDTVSRTINGKAFGGQLPVSGAQIAVYSFGTSGYGSAGTLLNTASTDSNGDFSMTFTCANPNAPVYALSIGGDAGFGTNSAIVEGAALGTCSQADAAPFIVINEISTTALAFSLSHFFSSNTSDGTTSDHFGSPLDLNAAVGRVNDVLIPKMIAVQNGYPNPSTATFTNEAAKIVMLGNILADCVNSSGPASNSCMTLFNNSTPSGGSKPTNVLEAAVNMALHPGLNVPVLFNLSGSQAFPGGQTTVPNDWTLAVSYKAPTMGLGLNTRTVSTLDIDTSGRVWFPTNAPGAAGVAYFDPNTLSFSSVFSAPGMVHPEQVAIDIDGETWATDTGSSIVAGFPSTNPTTPVALSMPGTTSTALTVLDDNTLRVGVITTANGFPSLAQIIGGLVYTPVPNTTVQANGFLASSLSGNASGGFAAVANSAGGGQSYGFYISPQVNVNFVLSQNDDLNQAVFTGTDWVVPLAGYNQPNPPTPTGDGLCIYTRQACYLMQDQRALRHPLGMVIDGAADLWLADSLTGSVEEIPLQTNGTYLDVNNVPDNLVFPHGTNYGGTMTNPAGIGVDNTGNVWVTNLGCYGNGCTPTSMVVSEMVGAATPTVVPLSANVVLGSGRGSSGTEPTARTPTRMPN